MSKDKITINLDKTSKLKFENVISGTEATAESFFEIPLSERMSIILKGKDIREDGKIISEIEIPPLKGFFNKSKLVENAKFNVKVSKSLFTPWEGILELKRPVEVDTCLKETSIEEKTGPIIQTSLSGVEEYLEEACGKSKKKNSKKKKKFKPSKLTNDYL